MNKKAKELIQREQKEKSGNLDLSDFELDRIPKEIGEMTWLKTLDLSINHISKVEGLESLSGLATLDLSHNQLSKLEGLEDLSGLNELYLSGNKISKVEGLESLSGLATLDLSHNQLSKLEGLEDLSGLNELYLSGNQLSKLAGLEGFSGLEKLDLSHNQLSKLEGLESLSGLEKLDLSNNQISKLEGLEGLSGLATLDLSNNQISKLEGLEGLSGLTTLDLSNNQISKLEGLEGLSGLTTLDLSNNQISKLEGLEGLSGLTTLDLSDNQINKLEGLEGLSGLATLILSGNQISKLEGLESLSGLATLILSGNQISKLEGLESLSGLATLILSGNQISKLEGLDGLSGLATLNLSSNQITKMEGLDGLSVLETLNLSGNQLSKLEDLERLSGLFILSLSTNRITKIEGLANLTNLLVLDLEDNPISSLSSEYQEFLSSVPFLDLKGTKISSLAFFYEQIKKGKSILWEDIYFTYGAPNDTEYVPISLRSSKYHVKRGINVKDCKGLEAGLVAAIQTGHDALVQYITAPKERLFEARVLVLGEPRAGKTTLRRKLQDVTNLMPTDQESTKAFEIEVEPYECIIDTEEGAKRLKYYLWDFGGQDYYRLLHQLFVTEQSIYIIVVDTDRNKNEEEIAFWLDTIERLGKDDQGQYGPVILLQNPKNNRPSESFTDLKPRYPFWQQSEDFTINLGALDKNELASYNPADLKAFRNFQQYLSRSFCQLKHIGREMPVKWILVKEALMKEGVNWITMERFHEICTEKGIAEKVQRNDLLTIFRQLGYLLHYKDSALKAMVILNREWVTDALYRVLDDEIVSANRGWFTKADATKIWHEEKYENRVDELLALMQEFKLCYQNPATKKYIVPSKLPSTVDNLPEWNENDNVKLRLQYDWMPKAIAIQLIVSLHEYITTLEKGEQWIWRKGAVLDGKKLDLGEVQVQIKDESDQDRISINARGEHSEMLIRTIMKKWREVHEPFKDKVKVTPTILCPCTENACHAETPHPFKYENVLNAKQLNRKLQCNESFKEFSAEHILKGIYDETTVDIDIIQKEQPNKHAGILELIRSDELEEVVSAISSPDDKKYFESVLHKSAMKTLTIEQKNLSRSFLAHELLDHFVFDGVAPFDTGNHRREPGRGDIVYKTSFHIGGDAHFAKDQAKIESHKQTFNFKDCNVELQGDLNDLAASLQAKGNNEEAKELQGAAQLLEKAEACTSPEEVKKKGIAKRFKRLIEDLNNEDSNLHKAVKGVKKGVSIAQDIAKGYNDIYSERALSRHTSSLMQMQLRPAHHLFRNRKRAPCPPLRSRKPPFDRLHLPVQ